MVARGAGAFLAAPLTIFVALTFQTFPETRWIASLMVAGAPHTEETDSGVPPPSEGQVVEPAS